ncbi:hypothetical protein ACP3TJ_09500, partial [Desulforudis sp. 1088]|uniref:hypothetical protein n=1 Tax=unclassified Candidatus Desulforudis TaxID=2635950 RepID=UPI003CF2A984
ARRGRVDSLGTALRKKGVEFCWDCEENKTYEKWRKHREAGKKVDSFKCYQKLDDDIAFIQKKWSDYKASFRLVSCRGR